jgi:hypothetical protein
MKYCLTQFISEQYYWAQGKQKEPVACRETCRVKEPLEKRDIDDYGYDSQSDYDGYPYQPVRKWLATEDRGTRRALGKQITHLGDHDGSKDHGGGRLVEKPF